MKKLLYVAACLAVIPLFAEGDELPPPNGGLSQMLVLFGIALLFFYFILWRPEQKRRKESESMRSSLKKGDRVNALGIIGTVAKINENTVILRMVDGAKIEVVKGAISEVTPCSEEDSKKAPD